MCVSIPLCHQGFDLFLVHLLCPVFSEQQGEGALGVWWDSFPCAGVLGLSTITKHKTVFQCLTKQAFPSHSWVCGWAVACLGLAGLGFQVSFILWDLLVIWGPRWKRQWQPGPGPLTADCTSPGGRVEHRLLLKASVQNSCTVLSAHLPLVRGPKISVMEKSTPPKWSNITNVLWGLLHSHCRPWHPRLLPQAPYSRPHNPNKQAPLKRRLWASQVRNRCSQQSCRPESPTYSDSIPGRRGKKTSFNSLRSVYFRKVLTRRPPSTPQCVLITPHGIEFWAVTYLYARIYWGPNECWAAPG